MQNIKEKVIQEYYSNNPIKSLFTGYNNQEVNTLSNYREDSIKYKINNYKYLKSLSKDKLINYLIDIELFNLQILKQHESNPQLYLDEMINSIYYTSRRCSNLSVIEKIEKIVNLFNDFPRYVSDFKITVFLSPLLFITAAKNKMSSIEKHIKDIITGLLESLPRKSFYLETKLQQTFEKAQIALQDFRKYLDKLYKRSEKEQLKIGIDRTKFQQMLYTYHRLTYTPEELTAIAQAQLKKTVSELKTIALRNNKGTNWPLLINNIKNINTSKSDVLNKYKQSITSSKDFLLENNLFPSLNKFKDNLLITETPKFEQSQTPFASYSEPELFTQNPQATFYVTIDNNQDLKRPDITTTAIHEVYPGHHLQSLYLNSNKSILNKMLELTTVTEGWALYSEILMAEQGYLKGDSYLIHLKDKLLRIARVIVDINLQLNIFTTEEAVSYLIREADLDKDTAKSEVEWYAQQPTTPLSYFIGAYEIILLREKFKSISKFHELFLSCGNIPIQFIREKIL